jgi:murein DD-endopeptidase MepM/ murein hydrolase activator NlpD
MAFQAVFVLLLLLTMGETAAESTVTIKTPQAIELFQGEIAELRVTARGATIIQGWLGKNLVHLFPLDRNNYAALIGADVDAKPGIVQILIRASTANGANSERQIPFRIKAKNFKKESFTVAPTFDEMTPETLAEIERERAAFGRAFAWSSPERFWDGHFVRPVPQEASASSFGFRRIINGVPRAPHSGTDLSSPAGTEVIATNHGRVVLAGNFFFAGGSVVLDHGAGLHTMYFHLSEIRVEEGAMVRKGDVIALSGMTGRVTGPHLHWGARAGGARVDPLQLLEKFGDKRKNVARAPAREKEKQDGEK